MTAVSLGTSGRTASSAATARITAYVQGLADTRSRNESKAISSLQTTAVTLGFRWRVPPTEITKDLSERFLPN
jgi:hypothetical protein